MQNLPELLKIDEMIAQEPSFMKIMADGIVTDEELKEQSDRVSALIEETEKRFQGEDLLFVKRLLAETNVLATVYHYHELQNFTNHVNL